MHSILNRTHLPLGNTHTQRPPDQSDCIACCTVRRGAPERTHTHTPTDYMPNSLAPKHCRRGEATNFDYWDSVSGFIDLPMAIEYKNESFKDNRILCTATAIARNAMQ